MNFCLVKFLFIHFKESFCKYYKVNILLEKVDDDLKGNKLDNKISLLSLELSVSTQISISRLRKRNVACDTIVINTQVLTNNGFDS